MQIYIGKHGEITHTFLDRRDHTQGIWTVFDGGYRPFCFIDFMPLVGRI